MAEYHGNFPDRKNEKASELETADDSLVVDRYAFGKEVLKNVDNNVFREMCKNNKKVKKEMSSYLDCEIDEIEIEDPTRSITTWRP